MLGAESRGRCLSTPKYGSCFGTGIFFVGIVCNRTDRNLPAIYDPFHPDTPLNCGSSIT